MGVSWARRLFSLVVVGVHCCFVCVLLVFVSFRCLFVGFHLFSFVFVGRCVCFVDVS